MTTSLGQRKDGATATRSTHAPAFVIPCSPTWKSPRSSTHSATAPAARRSSAGRDRQVEPTAHAYSQIKRVQPNLVILCVNLDDLDGIHVLSMLKLDAATRDIPVLTYTTSREDEEPDEELADPGEPEIFAPKPAAWMN